MEAYLDKLVLKRISAKNITHRMLTDPDFIEQERKCVIQDIKNRIQDDASLYSDLESTFQERQTRLKEELKIISKYLCLPVEGRAIWRNIIIKYTKEINLFKECHGESLDIAKLSDPQLSSSEAFEEWITSLSFTELRIIADLVADL
jgi:hypothetical protein